MPSMFGLNIFFILLMFIWMTRLVHPISGTVCSRQCSKAHLEWNMNPKLYWMAENRLSIVLNMGRYRHFFPTSKSGLFYNCNCNCFVFVLNLHVHAILRFCFYGNESMMYTKYWPNKNWPHKQVSTRKWQFNTKSKIVVLHELMLSVRTTKKECIIFVKYNIIIKIW